MINEELLVKCGCYTTF